MKMISILNFTGAMLLCIACVDDETSALKEPAKYPLMDFAVSIDSDLYHAEIDQYTHVAKINALDEEQLLRIGSVSYTLGDADATVYPDPETFVGNWQKEQVLVVSKGDKETAYTITFPRVGESNEGERKVLFFDNFNNGATPDDNWELCGYANNAWSQYFGNAEGYSNVRIEGGCLVLSADKADGKYRTGGIRSTFGMPVNTLVEVRARFDKAGGGFPAIWQMPIDGRPWPQSGEIDIMEWVQGTPERLYITIHTANEAMGDKSTSFTTAAVKDFDTAMHVYAAARTEEAVIFYIDGVEMGRYENEHLADPEAAFLQYPFGTGNFDIILNYSLGGLLNGNATWAGTITDADLPAEMWVDWVRVSEFSD